MSTDAELREYIAALEARIEMMVQTQELSCSLAAKDAYARGYQAGLRKRPKDDLAAYGKGYRAGQKWAQKRACRAKA